MTPLGFHMTFRLADDRVLCTSRSDRRIAARVLLEQGAPFRLAAFGCADSHVHAVVLCTFADAGRFARRLGNALHRRLRLPVPFQPARRKPLADQQHLYASVRYLLRQERHHAIEVDPFHEASALPDLLGLRACGAELAEGVRIHLPRLRRPELLELLGVPTLDTAPFALDSLGDAAAAALALPRLDARTRDSAAVRRAAVHAVGAAASSAALARLLEIEARTVKRLRRLPVAPALRTAVELQLRLRGALCTRESEPPALAADGASAPGPPAEHLEPWALAAL